MFAQGMGLPRGWARGRTWRGKEAVGGGGEGGREARATEETAGGICVH